MVNIYFFYVISLDSMDFLLQIIIFLYAKLTKKNG